MQLQVHILVELHNAIIINGNANGLRTEITGSPVQRSGHRSEIRIGYGVIGIRLEFERMILIRRRAIINPVIHRTGDAAAGARDVNHGIAARHILIHPEIFPFKIQNGHGTSVVGGSTNDGIIV